MSRQKKLDATVLSDKVCSVSGCRTRIKQNVLNQKPHADMCYKHYMERVRKHPDYVNKSGGSHES